MKNIRLVSFVLLLVIVSISCSLFTSTGSNGGSNAEVVDFVSPADPLNVTVQLDEASTASDMISPNGGSLSLTAADGTVFTLDVPAKALDADTLITMTAVKSITGAPLDDGNLAAVQLEPSGLFFNEIVTLTIIPGQEIPIENQIIFGYEGNGQDYHLAVLDPKSKEIKIKLMGFSGAGVGSGGDAQWAANLQVQANASHTRLTEKLGEAAQVDRRANLLEGDESSNKLGENAESILDQFYDQVVLKEMAAAELDCQFAKQAANDLVRVERLRQLFNIYPGQPIKTTGFFEKLAKLQKIYDECKKSYRVNDAQFSGRSWVTQCIPSLDKPYQISFKSPEQVGEYSFIPDTGNWNSGKAEVKLNTSIGGWTSTQELEGTYVITVLSKDSEGNILELSIDYNVKGSDVSCAEGKCFTSEVALSRASVPIMPNDGSCK
jgi:hypothetical protein